MPPGTLPRDRRWRPGVPRATDRSRRAGAGRGPAAPATIGCGAATPGVEIHQQPGLSRDALLRFLAQLTPRIGAHILQRPAVPGPRPELGADVVVPERHVAPLARPELVRTDDGAAVLHGRTVGRKDAVDLAMGHQYFIACAAVRPQHRPLRLHQRLVRDGQDAQLQPWIAEPPRVVGGDIDAEFIEEAEDAAGFGGARSVVVAGDQDDGRVRERRA